MDLEGYRRGNAPFRESVTTIRSRRDRRALREANAPDFQALLALPGLEENPLSVDQNAEPGPGL